MPTVRFIGRVLPAAIDVSIPNEPEFTWTSHDLGLDMTFRLQIQKNSVIVDCDVNKFVPADHLVPLFMRAYDIARASVDLAAFASGKGLLLIFDTFIDPAGATLPLAAHKPSLTALASAVKPGTRDFDKLLQVVLAEPALFVALHDLVEAITAPHHAAFHCARAIAGMRSLFVALGGSPDSRWATLRDKLQVSKSYLQAITNPAAATEGQPMHMDPGMQSHVIHGAWTIMNRYLEFRRRDGQPLPLSEFPLLV